MTQRERQLILNKYHNHCAYCGCEITLKTMQVDHIVPKRRGDTQEGLDYYASIGGTKIVKGTDTFDNYNPSCAACNRRKGLLTLEQFRSELELCHERMMRHNANYRQMMRYGQITLVNNGKVKFYFEKGGNQCEQ